jgi:hypothetical protein
MGDKGREATRGRGRSSNKKDEVQKRRRTTTKSKRREKTTEARKRRGRLEKKERTGRVRRWDRTREKRVPDGRGYGKVRVVSPRRRGKKWGDRVPTKKPCTKGANRQLRKKKGKGARKEVKAGGKK